MASPIWVSVMDPTYKRAYFYDTTGVRAQTWEEPAEPVTWFGPHQHETGVDYYHNPATGEQIWETDPKLTIKDSGSGAPGRKQPELEPEPEPEPGDPSDDGESGDAFEAVLRRRTLKFVEPGALGIVFRPSKDVDRYVVNRVRRSTPASEAGCQEGFVLTHINARDISVSKTPQIARAIPKTRPLSMTFKIDGMGEAASSPLRASLRRSRDAEAQGKYKDWSDMSEEQRRAVETLGWTEASWTDGDGATFERRWGAMSEGEQRAALLLGYDEYDFSEDLASGAGKDKDWRQMTERERSACGGLGWTEASWTGADDTPYERPWAAMSRQEQIWAGMLGLDMYDFAPEEEEEEEEGQADGRVPRLSLARTGAKDRDWSEMSEEERGAATSLGWSPASWAAGDGTLFERCWEQLSEQQRRDAATLGYERADFDVPSVSTSDASDLDEEEEMSPTALAAHMRSRIAKSGGRSRSSSAASAEAAPAGGGKGDGHDDGVDSLERAALSRMTTAQFREARAQAGAEADGDGPGEDEAEEPEPEPESEPEQQERPPVSPQPRRVPSPPTATAAGAAADADVPRRELNCMVTRSELVQSAGRGKFSVGSLPELEQALIAKLALEVESVAIEVWDKASGTFAPAGELGDLPDRCKLRLHESSSTAPSGAHVGRPPPQQPWPLAEAQLSPESLALARAWRGSGSQAPPGAEYAPWDDDGATFDSGWSEVSDTTLDSASYRSNSSMGELRVRSDYDAFSMGTRSRASSLTAERTGSDVGSDGSDLNFSAPRRPSKVFEVLVREAKRIARTRDLFTTPGDAGCDQLFAEIAEGQRQISLATFDAGVSRCVPQLRNRKGAGGLSLLRRAFASVDRNGDGFVKRRDFRALLEHAEFFNNMTALWEAMDGDTAIGRVYRADFLEFGSKLRRRGKPDPTQTALERAFASMDNDRNGYMDFGDFCEWTGAHFANFRAATAWEASRQPPARSGEHLWRELSEKERAAATGLGWTESSWTAGNTDVFNQLWSSLSYEEQRWARMLRYDGSDFAGDEEPLSPLTSQVVSADSKSPTQPPEAADGPAAASPTGAPDSSSSPSPVAGAVSIASQEDALRFLGSLTNTSLLDCRDLQYAQAHVSEVVMQKRIASITSQLNGRIGVAAVVDALFDDDRFDDEAETTREPDDVAILRRFYTLHPRGQQAAAKWGGTKDWGDTEWRGKINSMALHFKSKATKKKPVGKVAGARGGGRGKTDYRELMYTSIAKKWGVDPRTLVLEEAAGGGAGSYSPSFLQEDGDGAKSEPEPEPEPGSEDGGGGSEQADSHPRAGSGPPPPARPPGEEEAETAAFDIARKQAEEEQGAAAGGGGGGWFARLRCCVAQPAPTAYHEQAESDTIPEGVPPQ